LLECHTSYGGDQGQSTAACPRLLFVSTPPLNLNPTRSSVDMRHHSLARQVSFRKFTLRFLDRVRWRWYPDEIVCVTLTSVNSDKLRDDSVDSVDNIIYSFRWRRLFLRRSDSLHRFRKVCQTDPSAGSSRANHPPKTKTIVRVSTSRTLLFRCFFFNITTV